MSGNSTNTFLLEHAITSHVVYTYQSVPRDVYATIDKQARSEMAIFQQAWVHSDASYRPLRIYPAHD